MTMFSNDAPTRCSASRFPTLRLLWSVALLAGLLVLTGCDDGVTTPDVDNAPPEPTATIDETVTASSGSCEDTCKRYYWETEYEESLLVQMEMNVCIENGEVTAASGGNVSAYDQVNGNFSNVSVSNENTSYNPEEATLTADIQFDSGWLNLNLPGTENPLNVTMRVVPAGSSSNVGCFYAFNSGDSQRCPYLEGNGNSRVYFEKQWCTSPGDCEWDETYFNNYSSEPVTIFLEPQTMEGCSLCFWSSYSSTCNSIDSELACSGDSIGGFGCGMGSYQRIRNVRSEPL